MNILVACDSFKGCMASNEACRSIKEGLKEANPHWNIMTYPMADGGEGFARVLCGYIHGEMVKVQTYDLLGRKITAHYAWNEKRKLAILDVASCVGLNLYEREDRNPLAASSYGVGLMMKDALRRKCRKMIIGLGGSGSNDGGMGILKAFGAKFYDCERQRLSPNAYNLERIAFIDKRGFSFDPYVELVVACDVKNHLLGKQGATYTFGKQKGIFPSQMKRIDLAMTQYNQKIDQTFHVNMDALDGSGAAGGIGGVLLGVFKARMKPGIEVCMEYAKFEEAVKKADLIFTGEGQTDAQTLYGKVPYGIAQIASRHKVPVICLSGALGVGYEPLYNEGVIGIFSTADRAMDFKTALSCGSEKLESLAFSIGKLITGIKEIRQ
ncbi:glycerate kinase [Firmicutes bacterium M10-2]|nr:glycerate kinase [Firmicutes bacterium M10-2]